MKHLSAFLGVFLLATAALHGNNPASTMIKARSIYHPDGTRTESVNNPDTRELTETTYDARGVVVSRHLYLLNEKGQVSQGNIYDGAGNLVARAQSYFDEFGRLKESRLFNLQGECFQQSVHEYGPNGKAKKPKVINYNVRTPTMRPAVVDFTGTTPPPGAATPSPGTQAPPATPSPVDDKPKKSFLRRVFDKKEKK